LHGSEWNSWVRAGGWERHFTEEQVKGILLPDASASDLHPPLVVVPSGASNRGLLTHDLHLIFPIGLLVIGVRFLLRVLVAARGELCAPPWGSPPFSQSSACPSSRSWAARARWRGSPTPIPRTATCVTWLPPSSTAASPARPSWSRFRFLRSSAT